VIRPESFGFSSCGVPGKTQEYWIKRLKFFISGIISNFICFCTFFNPSSTNFHILSFQVYRRFGEDWLGVQRGFRGVNLRQPYSNPMATLRQPLPTKIKFMVKNHWKGIWTRPQPGILPLCKIKIQIYFYLYGSYIKSYILPNNTERTYLINYKLISYWIINYICSSIKYTGEYITGSDTESFVFTAIFIKYLLSKNE
jgi:hypothetical protein